MHAYYLLAFGLQASAHMILSKPQPFPYTSFYSKDGTGSPDNGPLTGRASTAYPCNYKGDGSYDFTFARTDIPAGSDYSVAFEGSAVHGGGSCQFSLTTDTEPTAQSEFKVIHSIEGGCPARNTPGNLAANAEAVDPNEYSFKMPSNIPEGNYTFAWSWLNKVGNREFYMGCAPISVSGGSGDKSSLDALPNMFIANIPVVPSQCTTEGLEGSSVKYQNPGSSLEVNNDDETKKEISGDLSGCYAPPGGSSGAGASAAPSPQTPTATAPAAKTTPKKNSPADSPAPSPEAPAQTSEAPTPAAPSPMTTPGSSGSGSGSCTAGSVACSGEGFQCISEKQFGLCNFGCMVAQDLAAGTTCSDNAIKAAPVRRNAPARVPYVAVRKELAFKA